MSTISRVWPTALKLGCVTNFDMLFLVMWLISLVDEIQFMLINSRMLHKVYWQVFLERIGINTRHEVKLGCLYWSKHDLLSIKL